MKPSRLQTIVVPLDGSALAECAIPIALGLLPSENGRLILMRVPVYTETQSPIGAEYNMFWPEIRDTPDTFRQVYQDTEAYLTHIAEITQRPGIEVETRVEEGDRAGAIVDTAAAVNADLIIMTTHGRTGVTRWVIGSITERVLHDAPCPVLAVRAAADCGPSQPMQPIAQRILVPLDGSELAEPALAPAVTIAKTLTSDLILLRVVSPPASDTDAVADEYLEARAEECRGEGIRVSTVTVPQSGSGAASVATAILDFAAAEAVDLIAMSTHGRSGLRRWVYGSVTEKVLHNSEVGLLIVRP